MYGNTLLFPSLAKRVEVFGLFSAQGDLSGSKLTEVEIKKVLKLRSDFKVETINTLPAFQSC